MYIEFVITDVKKIITVNLVTALPLLIAYNAKLVTKANSVPRFFYYAQFSCLFILVVPNPFYSYIMKKTDWIKHINLF